MNEQKVNPISNLSLDPISEIIDSEILMDSPLSKDIYQQVLKMVPNFYELEVGQVLEIFIKNGNRQFYFSVLEKEQYCPGYLVAEISQVFCETVELKFKVALFYSSKEACIWEWKEGYHRYMQDQAEGEVYDVYELYCQHIFEFSNFSAGSIIVSCELYNELNEKAYDWLMTHSALITPHKVISAGSLDAFEKEDTFRENLEKFFNDIKNGHSEEALKQVEFLEKRLKEFHILHQSDPIFHL